MFHNALNGPPTKLPGNKSHEGEGFNALAFEDQAGEEFEYAFFNSTKRRMESDDNVPDGKETNLDVASKRTEAINGKLNTLVKAA